MTLTQVKPRCKNLVLDSGPLLSLSPLRGLAETYFTVPQVLAELKDKRAREHFERLGLNAGVRIEIQSPDAASLAHVIQFAKKTGDYAVLSHPDLCVLALTYSLDEQAKREAQRKSAEQDAENTSGPNEPSATSEPEAAAELADALAETSLGSHEAEGSEGFDRTFSGHSQDNRDSKEDELENDQGDEEGLEDTLDVDGEEDLEPLDVELHRESDDAPEQNSSTRDASTTASGHTSDEPIYDDPSDSDDGEGEWITPTNVSLHKSRALDLLPDVDAKGKRQNEVINAGCMTADFAMQNVLLQMGLSLVGVEGKRIEKVKSWVLRCHACFKICKDSSKKFCPSCGNPTLLRASVTIASPTASANAPAMQIHLKRNFQYKTRGTIYSIPNPKPGSAKKGPGEGLILREDQTQFLRAKKYADGKKEKEEKRLTKGILGRSVAGETGVVGVGSWMDPDWMPEMITVGPGGKGRSVRHSGMDGDMPVIGYGRKNPNERKKRK